MRPTKLNRELAGAIADEERRSAIDAAKKKAVAQHADYDTFKKMVRLSLMGRAVLSGLDDGCV